MIRTNTKSATNTYIIIIFIFSLVIITKRVEIAMMIIGENNCEGRDSRTTQTADFSTKKQNFQYVRVIIF